LPEIIIPASLTKQLTKSILLDVNTRALITVRKKLQPMMKEADLVPLIVDTLAVDYAYLDYGYQEQIFRAAFRRHDVISDRAVKTYMKE